MKQIRNAHAQIAIKWTRRNCSLSADGADKLSGDFSSTKASVGATQSAILASGEGKFDFCGDPPGVVKVIAHK